MKSSKHKFAHRMVGVAAGTLAAMGAWAAPLPQATATTGAIEFTAMVTPTDAKPQPARDFTFYLLRRSLADIHAEVEAQDPPPVLNAFIDTLSVSPELKAWMKKNQTVELSGSDFIHKIKPDDMLGVPEFKTAYITYNANYPGSDFPQPKAKLSDQQKNPEKYKRDVQAYHDALLHYYTMNPLSAEGMEVELADINPSRAWLTMQVEERDRVENRTNRLAQSQYLVTQADTDLNGHGAMNGIPPGNYWLGTLGERAQAGDVHDAWNVPVTVIAGQTTRIALTNLNAVETPTAPH